MGFNSAFKGLIVLIQHLISSLSISGRPVHRLRENTLFYNKFFRTLCMFQTFYAHLQRVEMYLCSIWYRHFHMWLSGAKFESEFFVLH